MDELSTKIQEGNLSGGLTAEATLDIVSRLNSLRDLVQQRLDISMVSGFCDLYSITVMH
jgi:hypothetical protein